MKYKPIKEDKKYDEISLAMMDGFLRRHFPVKRIKPKRSKRFRRGIIVDPGFINTNKTEYFLTPYSETKELFTMLYKVLYSVFGFTSDEITQVIYQYLYL